MWMGSYPSAEMQSIYSATQAHRVRGHLLGESYPLQRYSRCILQLQPKGINAKFRVRTRATGSIFYDNNQYINSGYSGGS